MFGIRVCNLSIGHGKTAILENINFTIPIGKIICLVGPNGAGKTTLMNTILGRIPSISGEIIYDGVSIREMAAAIQHPSYFPYLTGNQNVNVVSSFWGLKVDAGRCLNEVGISPGAHNRKASTYSTGMKERLELCLAMLSRPKFLFLDEPQNGLDPDGMVALGNMLRAYRDEGNSVLLSTHLLHEIEGLPDECIIIRDGLLRYVQDLSGTTINDLYHSR